jgi:hypothetical protein
MTSLPYHERQLSLNQLCLVHALNMLLGEKRVDKRKMDQVCELLSPSSSSWWNPHRSALGLGNYDVNVAMYILENEFDCEVSFFDTRKSVDEISLDQCSMGLLLNVPGSRFLPGSRHWISYKKYRRVVGEGDEWYLFDSQKQGPLKVDSMTEAMTHHLSSGDHILLVTKKTPR